MNDWIRGVLTPIIVAVIVGMATSYLSTRESIMIFEQRLSQQEQQIQELRIDAKNFAVLQERVTNMGLQLDRIEKKLDQK